MYDTTTACIQTLPTGNDAHPTWVSRLVATLALAGLYLVSRWNYLLFHSLVEIFSIAVAGSLFSIAWTSRRYGRNPYLLFIGIAYLFVGGIDLLHTLSFTGMNIFRDYAYYTNQLWIGARYLESISLLLAFLFGFRARLFRPTPVFVSYGLATALLISSILVWKNFPECFIDGVGLTPFKKNSEYVICAILLLNIGLLFRYRARFGDYIFRLLLWSLVCTIVSELAFTFYVDNYGFSNMVGHYFKLLSFWFIYRAIVETSIEQPYKMIFHDLDRANHRLRDEVTRHRQTAEELRTALGEVNTLSGLLPICACCKKIRDDQGYWNRMETYITKHSEVQFSHGYCPECYQKELDRIDTHFEDRQVANGEYAGEAAA
ncbi:MAG: hypothetical protein NT087_05165 [Deltaproteobacteria bacterium]|nr:hypothetical protein [Deltaproteobacteria bacterium]